MEVVAQSGTADDLLRHVAMTQARVAIVDIDAADPTDEVLRAAHRSGSASRTSACSCSRSTSSPATRSSCSPRAPRARLPAQGPRLGRRGVRRRVRRVAEGGSALDPSVVQTLVGLRRKTDRSRS